MIPKYLAFGALTLSLYAGAATAAPLSINFDGSQNGALINGFYNGGTDSFGNSGANYGVTFNPEATIRVDYGKTYLANVTSIAVRDGFTGGLTFQYSTPGGDPVSDSFDFYVKLDTHIDQSYSQLLNATYFNDCTTRYAGNYCYFTGGFGRAYDATARVVTFSGPRTGPGSPYGNIALDMLTIGVTPTIFGPDRNIPANSYPGDEVRAEVPEPATTALLGLGLLGVIAVRRRRK